jgi:TonB family protein
VKTLALLLLLSQTFPTMVRQVVTPISPMFPEAARSRGVRSAEVDLELTIGADGIVKNVRVVKSAGAEFDDAAMTAARLTVFTQAKGTTLQPFKVTFRLL